MAVKATKTAKPSAVKTKKIAKVRIKVKTIDISAKEWTDRTYGNSYYAGYVTVNFGKDSAKTFRFPEKKAGFEYGYRDSYISGAIAMLRKNGYLHEFKEAPSTRALREAKILLRASIQHGCKQSELKAL